MIFRLPRRMEDLALFTRHLAGAMQARVPLDVILRAYALENRAEPMGRVADSLAGRIETGEELSAAMDAYPRVFPAAYRRLVRLGEQGRTLGGVMRQLGERLEDSLKTYEYFRRAAIYPAVILILIFTMALFVNMKIVPKYTDIFMQMGANTGGRGWGLGNPAVNMHVGLLGFSCLLLLPIAFLLGTALGLRVKGFGYGRLALQLPLIGPIFRRAETAHMANYLSLLLNNHIPLSEALGLLSDSTENTYVQAALVDFHRRYQAGERLSDLLGSQPLFPASMAAMIAVAEDQGGLAETLHGLGNFYNERTIHGLAVLREVFEPLMLILVGLFISIFLLATYLPLFEIPKLVR